MTGWAALRWRGAAYFGGTGPAGDGVEPVELVVPCDTSIRSRDAIITRRRAVGCQEVETVDGLPVATTQRALLDEIHRRDDLWSAVQAIDMTAAARLISVWLFATFLGFCNSRDGVPLAREAASLAVDESRSPRETWWRLVWCQVARLDEPLVNVSVYDRSGRLIGIPDLFDPVAGLVGEYSGEIHRGRDRHRRDVVREEAFRAHGLEYVEAVSGDSRAAAGARILATRRRARFAPERGRSWTLERPSWSPAPETLDEYLWRTGQVRRLIACDSAPDADLEAVLDEYRRRSRRAG
ncbi:hypothetical protein [Nocardioides sp. GXZ039]|uniref:hypothetical protein n=1 Tax=Nocardioides sp. GXZ039 TaxID=3136018 RepID=UPI0030F38D73